MFVGTGTYQLIVPDDFVDWKRHILLSFETDDALDLFFIDRRQLYKSREYRLSRDGVVNLAAFDLVRAHFHALLEIISSEKGAVVKTIGDAVMATFVRPEHALAASLRMRSAMAALNARRGTEDLIVKIGIHEGPCLAVMLNERQDYFGQTVNIAARVQSLSTSQEIHITGPVIDSPAVAMILEKEAIKPIQKQAALRGIADKIVVYEIP